MRILFLTLAGLGLLSCSSSAPRRGLADDPLDELRGIENQDFGKEQSLSFHRGSDQFAFDKRDSLSKESIARAPKGKLDEVVDQKNETNKILGLCYQGDYKAAFEVSDKIYSKYKKRPPYWNAIGTCYYRGGNNRKAMLFYNKALDLEKGYAPALNNLGVIQLGLKRDQKALEFFKKAADSNPYSMTPIFNISQLYLEYGIVEESQKYLEALYRKSQKDSDVLNALASSFLFQSEPQKALRYFTQIPSYAHRKPHIGLNYAVALHLSGKNRSAKTLYSRIEMDAKPRWRDYHQRVGKLLKSSQSASRFSPIFEAALALW